MKAALNRREKKSIASALTLQQVMLMGGLFGLLAVTLHAAQPAWWSSRGAVLAPVVTTNEGVVTTNYVQNDYAAVTQGQLKQFTARAADELNANLPGGAGTNLNTMVSNWAADYLTNGYNATNIKPSDYTAMNVGQLKYIGNMVWSQLMAGGYTNAVPTWLARNTNTDNVAANLGQLKEVFNFDPSISSMDTNGLPLAWEEEYFGQTGLDPTSSPDGNGLTLLQDYEQGNNPTNYYSQGGTNIVPTLSIVSGNNQVSAPGQTAADPLVVLVQNSVGGAPLVNAPIIFTVSAGGGLVSTAFSNSGGPNLAVATDGSGLAHLYYQNPFSSNVISSISASTGGQTVNFTSSTSTEDGTFDAPTSIRATYPSPTEVDITWVNNATTATGILIEQSTNDVTWTTTAALTNSSATNYAVSGLTAGQVYNFRIAPTK